MAVAGACFGAVLAQPSVPIRSEVPRATSIYAASHSGLGFQGSWLLHSQWGWLSRAYILWHDFFIAMLGLAAVLVAIQLCHLSGARAGRVQTGVVPGSVWTASIIGATVLDLALMIFCSSPLEAVLKP